MGRDTEKGKGGERNGREWKGREGGERSQNSWLATKCEVDSLVVLVVSDEVVVSGPAVYKRPNIY